MLSWADGDRVRRTDCFNTTDASYSYVCSEQSVTHICTSAQHPLWSSHPMERETWRVRERERWTEKWRDEDGIPNMKVDSCVFFWPSSKTQTGNWEGTLSKLQCVLCRMAFFLECCVLFRTQSVLFRMQYFLCGTQCVLYRMDCALFRGEKSCFWHVIGLEIVKALYSSCLACTDGLFVQINEFTSFLLIYFSLIFLSLFLSCVYWIRVWQFVCFFFFYRGVF